ncbi:MAG: glycosyltransferase family 4 protein [Sulfitobacter sp.]|uniref:glycosyltransferase family 4 protein n=1 Tax=Alphaproteobacteria TaxID=28211 RepID=UPI003264CF91
MHRIVHLIPYHAIGGVEIAAKSLPTISTGKVQMERQYLVRKPGSSTYTGEYHGPNISLNSPRAYFHAIWRLYQDPPDLLVASLWRSALVLILVKLLRPRMKTVIFLHSDKDAHFADKLVSQIAMRASNAIWADSTATLMKRVPCRLQSKGRVISFLVEQRALPQTREPEPRFVFWGRLSAEKGLKRAVELFASIAARRSNAQLTLIGPDGGMEDDLRTQISELGLSELVTFKGPMQHDEIVCEAKQASFYLQTSREEGMAMSVVEAMQAGLVPVVTPVGEIPRYCRNGESAVIVHDDNAAMEAVLALLSEPERYRRMSRAAAKYWQKKPIYRDDFLIAAKDLIARPDNEA